jgi:hypothetical protein
MGKSSTISSSTVRNLGGREGAADRAGREVDIEVAGRVVRVVGRKVDVEVAGREGGAWAGRVVAVAERGRPVIEGARRAADAPELRDAVVTGTVGFVTWMVGGGRPVTARDDKPGLMVADGARVNGIGVDLVADGARGTTRLLVARREEEDLTAVLTVRDTGRGALPSLEVSDIDRGIERELAFVFVARAGFAGVGVGSRRDEKKKGVSGVNFSSCWYGVLGGNVPSMGVRISISGTGVSRKRRSMSASVKGAATGSSRVTCEKLKRALPSSV